MVNGGSITPSWTHPHAFLNSKLKPLQLLPDERTQTAGTSTPPSLCITMNVAMQDDTRRQIRRVRARTLREASTMGASAGSGRALHVSP